MIVFIRTLPLTLALAALLAFPSFIGNTKDGGAGVIDSVSRLQAFMGGDLEALDGFQAPKIKAPEIKATDWSAARYKEQWAPVVGSARGLRQGDVSLAAILRATELPTDAHLARIASR